MERVNIHECFEEYLNHMDLKKNTITAAEYLAMNKGRKKIKKLPRSERPQKPPSRICPFCNTICDNEEHKAIVARLSTSNIR